MGQGHTWARRQWVGLGMDIRMIWAIAAWEMDTVGAVEVEAEAAGETGAPAVAVHRIVVTETGATAGLGATLAVARVLTAVGGIVATGTVDETMMIGGGTMMIGAGVLLVAIAAKAGAALVSTTVQYLLTAGSTMKLETSLTSQKEGGAPVGVAALLSTMASTVLPQRNGRGKILVAGVGGAGAGIVQAVGANEAKAVAVAKNLRRRDALVAGADPGTDIDCYHISFMTRGEM